MSRPNPTFHHSDLFVKPPLPMSPNTYKHTCRDCKIEFVDTTWCTRRCKDCRKKVKK